MPCTEHSLVPTLHRAQPGATQFRNWAASTWRVEGGFLMEDQGGNRLELEAKQELLLEKEICDALR